MTDYTLMDESELIDVAKRALIELEQRHKRRPLYAKAEPADATVTLIISALCPPDTKPRTADGELTYLALRNDLINVIGRNTSRHIHVHVTQGKATIEFDSLTKAKAARARLIKAYPQSVVQIV